MEDWRGDVHKDENSEEEAGWAEAYHDAQFLNYHSAAYRGELRCTATALLAAYLKRYGTLGEEGLQEIKRVTLEVVGWSVCAGQTLAEELLKREGKVEE